MSTIRKFSIYGLFGIQNFEIPFENNIKILIGENGMGKTTILNSLYYLLTKKWHKLVKIPFESIALEFNSNASIALSKKQLEAYILDDKRQRKRGAINIVSRLRSMFDVETLKQELIKNNQIIHQDVLNFVIQKRIGQSISAPAGLIAENLIRLITDDFLPVFDDINKILDTELDTTILYFPTYRRVEEELQNLGQLRKISKNEFDFDQLIVEEEERKEIINIEEETLIQFGMEDVEQRIKNVLSQINESSIKGFTKVTADILSQMLTGFPKATPESIANLNKSDIEIILNRVRGNLSENDRNNILGILNSSKLEDKRDLVYFLNKLIEIYQQQRQLDNSIKNFVSVCNNYLVDKVFVFNESTVTIDVIRSKTENAVKLNQLSSGEKQIVSLFSKIYLETHESITVLFDEPELSLSIKWQSQLLPDILKSEKCKLLLAVTHSPFIFKNELDTYAVGMNVFIN